MTCYILPNDNRFSTCIDSEKGLDKKIITQSFIGHQFFEMELDEPFSAVFPQGFDLPYYAVEISRTFFLIDSIYTSLHDYADELVKEYGFVEDENNSRLWYLEKDGLRYEYFLGEGAIIYVGPIIPDGSGGGTYINAIWSIAKMQQIVSNICCN